MAAPSIVVVDYHKGNLSSVVRGLVRAGAEALASDDPAVIAQADALVVPGVGSFYDAITYMAQSGEAEAVLCAAAANKPVLGICLGLQTFFDRGDEGVPEDVEVLQTSDPYGKELAPGTVFEAEGKHWVRGMGLIHGSCTRLDGSRLKVPHVGWDQVHLSVMGMESPLLDGFAEGANMYFTHSYAVDTDALDENTLARTHYTRSFACMVNAGSVYGCQFHPEKSSGQGQTILENFVTLAVAS